MAVQNNVVQGRTVAKTDTPLMFRVKNAATGALLTQASVATITYNIQDLTAAVSVATGTLTPASVVFNALQQADPTWTQDSATLPGVDGLFGYNFKWVLPGTTVVYPANSTTYDFQGNPIAHLWKIDILFTFVAGGELTVPNNILVTPELV